MLFCLLVSYLFFILFFRHLRNSFPFLTLDFYKDSFRSILNFLCSVVLWSIFILVFLWSLVCLTSYLHLLITALVYTNVHILSHFITIFSTFVYIYHINKFKNKRFFVKKKDGPNINREDNSYAKKQIKQTRTPTKIVNVTRWFGMICSFTPSQLCPSWRHNTRILCLCTLIIVCLRLYSICVLLSHLGVFKHLFYVEVVFEIISNFLSFLSNVLLINR